MGGQQERVCGYERPATYGRLLDGNPCAGCGRSEADHLTTYVAPLAGDPPRYLIVHALGAADAGDIAARKSYAVVGPIREATADDDAPVKTLRPWS